ncbi:MAG: hypothetical protein K2X45_02055 [Phreatobacter sp.]|nr:hypothetical protein [Phreatobacter sp.]
MSFRSLITGHPVRPGIAIADQSPEAIARALDDHRGSSGFSAALNIANMSLSAVLAGYQGAASEAGRTLGEWVADEKRIAVFGDFDVDGLTSVAIASCGIALLKGMEWSEDNLRQRIAAAGVIPMIPERADGYGLQPSSVDAAISMGAEAMLVLDSGAGAAAGLKHAVSRGLPIIVLDHHAVQQDVADFLLTGPKNLVFVNSHDPRYRVAGHPVETCTGHMTLALILDAGAQFFEDFRNVGNGSVFEALAALSVVADMMDLEGEKRVLVRDMLTGLDHGAGPGGLRALVAAARERSGASLGMIDPRRRAPIGDIDVDTLGFTLAPRLNSLARSQLAEEALWFILASFQEAVRRLDGVDRVNVERQAVQHDVSQAVLDTVMPFVGPSRRADEILAAYPDRAAIEAAALVVESADKLVQALVIPGLFIIASAPFRLGVAGLVAGTIAVRAGTPVLVTARNEDTENHLYKGSGRVPERHPIADGVLEDAFGAMVAHRAGQIGGGGGGHNAAFGVSFRRAAIDDPDFVAFAVDIAFLIRSAFEAVEPERQVLEGAFDILTSGPGEACRIHRQLAAFAPFGKGLKAPLMAVPARDAFAEEKRSSTLQIRLGDARRGFKAVGFAKQIGPASLLRRHGVFDAIASGDAFLVGDLSKSFYGHDRQVNERTWAGPSVEMKISDIIVRT